MSDPVVLVEKSGGIATITLNRPDSMNAVSTALSEQVSQAFIDLQRDEEVGVAIVTGAGRAFCAGMDLKELGSGGKQSRGDKIGNPMDDALAGFDRPIIAAVNGFAVTAGFELALMCDVIIASTEAKFVDSHVRVGILPGWGLGAKLSRVIGPVRAKAASLTANPITADQAERWGLVAQVVSPEDLMPTCRGLAEDMLSCPPDTLVGYKRLIDECLGMDLGAAILYERAVAMKSAMEMDAERIAQRRSGIQQRNRARTQE
jgi:enoyl-CoA hydratase